jgi:3-oxoacyl-[acyl-carrier-protein] synthase-3
VGDVSLFVFHQASQLALDGLQKSLAIPDQKMVVDLQDTGNLVSSSIPVALSRVLEARRIEPNQLVLLCGFGVGLSWACALVRFNGEKV